MTAYDKLMRASEKNKSFLCVGLDTEIEKLPEHIAKTTDGIFEFNKAIIDATLDLVNSYKINFAFYEQYGLAGIEAMQKTIDYIPNDILKIADAKRGDIGNTSKSYARACFEAFKCDSITVHPYMGSDSVKPFLEWKDKLVFVLALTSNPGSADFEKLSYNGEKLYESVIKKTMQWADSTQIGYVVGATHPSEIAELRKIASQNPFLIPGIGAQGGDLKATLAANGDAPKAINSSRAILFASSGKDFADAARKVAQSYLSE